MFMDCIFATSVGEDYIIASFNNGHEPVTYTRDILDLLVTDKTVDNIVDAQTGEVIYASENC